MSKLFLDYYVLEPNFRLESTYHEEGTIISVSDATLVSFVLAQSVHTNDCHILEKLVCKCPTLFY